MSLWLSLYNLLLSFFFPNSSINLYNQIISLLASVVATYFAYIDESETNLCSFKTQITVVPLTIKTYPMVIILLSLSPAISKSTYPYKIVFEPPKWNAYAIVPLKYLRIHFTSIQWSLPGLLIYLLTTPTTCAIFGLVHTIAYIKLPTAEEYGTLDM